MIIWITGNTESGKTTLAKQMKRKNTIILDGDEIRDVFRNKDLSFEGRWEHNLRTARLAKLLESQGFDVLIALICPYKKLRDEVQKITDCSFIYLSGGQEGSEYPYEYEDKFYFRK